MMFRTVGLVTLVAAGACSGDGIDPGFPADLDTQMSTMTETETGLRYLDLRPGAGVAAGPGLRVRVHYTGWLLDGTKFDSSRDRGEPFPFLLGTGAVIAGWDEGVDGMRIGGQRRLVIPGHLGYGERGSAPSIPPNATLVFDVELLEVTTP